MSVSPRSDTPGPRIALIHALAHSVEPINAAFARHWPEARCMNLLDDSLSADLADSPHGLDGQMHTRFLDLANYAVGNGAQAILFTCSAFGACIEAVAAAHPGLPVLKPNSAMIHAVTLDLEPLETIGLLATFGPTLASMPPEFPAGVRLKTCLVEGALQALDAHDLQTHDRLIAEQARQLRDQGCTRIAMAQFSMARARDLCQTATGMPVYTTVHSAVDAMRHRFSNALGGCVPPAGARPT